MTKHDNVSQGKIMKATEFVKKFGWERAKREVALIGTIAVITGDRNWLSDLKRLVESHELVKYLGGYERTRARLKMARKNGTTFGADHLRWEKAIADVEACQ
ncbi:hypothetical protein [Acinetobacter radioresistens]|uniref:hypothetical protein n=1 Tax=Acinetobacter radioresistens TaxID=40216 RepID=UPI000DAEA3A8|nr:hypothetical protein [Acinetobacter radioresistens]AWV87075.1 hypothetical protein DOM24_10920 [Acinetobacter radioresistens]MCX0328950.1 hypothetical protein [Acinetobacter radioresistens]